MPVETLEKDYYAITHRFHHIMNPILPERWLRVGDVLNLTARSRVLDVGCGKGEPAMLWAEKYRCEVLGIDAHEGFIEEARLNAGDRNLTEYCRFLVGDGAEASFNYKGDTFDAVVALGVTFIFGTLREELAALLPLVKRGGYLVLGEPVWNFTPVPADVLEAENLSESAYRSDVENFALIEAAGGELAGLFQVSREEWDLYESLQWKGAIEHYRQNASDSLARVAYQRMVRQRATYLRYGPRVLGMSLYLVKPKNRG